MGVMMFKKYIKSDSYDLIFDENKNFDDLINEFVYELTNEFNEFKNRFQKEKTEWKKHTKIIDKERLKNYSFKPEKLTIASPLTIINAAWGIGKTFFIEQLLKKMQMNKINNNIFEKSIVIDAWKFSHSKNIPDDFIKELSNSLFDINYSDVNNENEEKKENYKKLFGLKMFNKLKGLNWSMESISINNEGGLNLPFLSLSAGISAQFLLAKTKDNINFGEIKNESEKILKKIEENTTPTIIFIDNIERLNEGAWDLLKTILKFQNYPNFIIVLAVNINKLKNYDKANIQNETIIQKYINIKYFNLKPSYNNFLVKYFNKINWINDEKISLIENILNYEIEGRILTIRELESRFHIYKINQQKSFEEFFKIFYDHIWCNNELIDEYIIKKINLLLNNHKNLKLKLNEFWEKLKLPTEGEYNYIFDDSDEKLVKELNNNINNIEEINKNYFNSEFVNYFHKIESQNGEYLNIFIFLYYVDLDYLIIIEDMKHNNIKLIKNVKNQIKILSIVLEKSNKMIDKINKNIEKENKKLTSGKLLLNELSELQSNNPEKFSDDNKENEKLDLERKMDEWNNTISSLEERKKSFEKLSDKIVKKNKFNEINLDKIIKEEVYLSYIEEIKIIKKNIENLEFRDTSIKILKKKFGEDAYNTMNNNSFVFDFSSQKK